MILYWLFDEAREAVATVHDDGTLHNASAGVPPPARLVSAWADRPRRVMIMGPAPDDEDASAWLEFTWDDDPHAYMEGLEAWLEVRGYAAVLAPEAA